MELQLTNIFFGLDCEFKPACAQNTRQRNHDVITGFICSANYRGSVIYRYTQQNKNDLVYKAREGECEKGIYS